MRILPIAAALIALAAPPAQAAESVNGQWRANEGAFTVDIEPCASGLCGTVTAVAAPPSKDRPAPQLGWVILTGLTAQGDGKWHGQMHNYMNSKLYDCDVTLKDAGHLVVRPYIGVPLIGMTHVWTRP